MGYRLRRWRYELRHPIGVYRRSVYWPVRTFVERGRRGWSVSDAWGADTYIAGVMAGMCEQLRRSCSYPITTTPEEWESILAEMAEGFRRWANHWEDPDGGREAYRLALRSIRLMHRWFGDLWD